MKPIVKHALIAFFLLAISMVIWLVVVTLKHSAEVDEAERQTDAIAEELWPMVQNNDYEAIAKLAYVGEGKVATADDVQEYIQNNCPDWEIVSKFSKDNISILAYGSTGYKTRIKHITQNNNISFELRKVGEKWLLDFRQ